MNFKKMMMTVLGISAALVVGYFGTRKQDIFEAKTLGGVPIHSISGQGKPVVYLAQEHPGRRYSGDLADSQDVETSIDEIVKAALEAYDIYGIKAIFIEGYFNNMTDAYNAKKQITLQFVPEEKKYVQSLETMLNEREWNWYPESLDAAHNWIKTKKQCEEKFNECISKLQYHIRQLNNLQLTSVEEANKEITRLRDLRECYQQEMNTFVLENKDELIYATYTLRERAVIDTVKKALKKENGIVVIYGAGHAKRLQEAAKQENIPFILVESGHLQKNSTVADEERILSRYKLPQVELSVKK